MEDTIKLFVVGDSFSVMPGADDPSQNWIRLIAAELAERHGKPVVVVNRSIMGSSQDFMWMVIHGWMEADITANDYMVIALTHPGRYWYLDRVPELSNSNIIDLDRHCSKDEAKAIELFIKHIQRPMLDTISLINRLTYLGYHVLKKGLRKPLIVKCFAQDLHQVEAMEELNIADGSLYEDIQFHEFDKPEYQQNNNYFSGLDCRFNHMCLSNHKILAARCVESLMNGTRLDLKEGYLRGMLKDGTLEDTEFCEQELDKFMLAHRATLVNKPRLPWLKRVNLEQRASSTCVQSKG